MMHDCSKDVVAYHKEKVTLPKAEQEKMKERRNNNRDRLKSRLETKELPAPKIIIKQGSYAMKTMVQEENNDYDIDDGIYFTQKSLKGPSGGDKSALDARKMIQGALDDKRFKDAPSVRTNCVRVYYEDGSHVDMPVYRIRDDDGEYELASASDWKVSRAADVEKWFKDADDTKSPADNKHQFRHIVRMLKKFARSRASWKTQITSGFAISVLTQELYSADSDRDDKSLRNTMQNIYDRLQNASLEVKHPVTPDAMITNGADDAKMKFFRGKLKDALKALEVLDKPDCTHKEALKAWDTVFNADGYFEERYDGEDEKKAAEESAIFTGLISTKSDPKVTDKRGEGRFG